MLKVAEHTIENQLTSIYEEAGARDRAHSVILALRQGRLYFGGSS